MLPAARASPRTSNANSFVAGGLTEYLFRAVNVLLATQMSCGIRSRCRGDFCRHLREHSAIRPCREGQPRPVPQGAESARVAANKPGRSFVQVLEHLMRWQWLVRHPQSWTSLVPGPSSSSRMAIPRFSDLSIVQLLRSDCTFNLGCHRSPKS